MDVPIWIHTVETAYRGSATIPADDTLNPFSVVYQKTNDGLTFQGRWDAHPRGIEDIPDVVRADRDIYGDQGIGWIPWGVIHGRWEGSDSTSYAAAEGSMAARIAKAAAGDGERAVYIIDLEPHNFAPFPAFWRDDLGAGAAEVEAFIETFVDAGGEEIWLTVDPRQAHLPSVSFDAWAQAMRGGRGPVTRILPMTYFTDFVAPRVATSGDADVVLSQAVEIFGRYGVPPAKIFPILPAPALPAVMEFAIGLTHRLGYGGFSVYQRGNLSLGTANAIAEMDDPWAEADSPAPGYNREHVLRTFATLDEAITDVQSTANRLDSEAADLRTARQQLLEDLGLEEE